MADCLPAPNLYAFDSMTRCVIALALAALAAAPAAGPTYYAIVADGGTIIGYATHEDRQGSEGPETGERSEVALRGQEQPERRAARAGTTSPSAGSPPTPSSGATPPAGPSG